MGYGQKANLGIIFQNSFGTVGDTGSAHFIPLLSENLKLNIPPMYSENMRGVIDEGDTYEGPRTVDGEIATEAMPEPAAVLFKTVLEETAKVTSDDLQTRTFKPRVSDFDEVSANNPFTAYAYRDTGSAQLFYDLNGSGLEIGIANGEFLKLKTTIVGGQYSEIANVAAAYPTGKRWTWDVASTTVGGSAVPELMDLTIVLDDGALEAIHVLNASKYPNRIKRTNWRTIAVNGTLKFDNQTEYQQFISQSERELIVHCEGNVEIQSGYYDSITIKLPLLRYEEAQPTVEGPGQIEMSFTARGKYSVDSGTALEITHVSTLANL